MLASSTSRIYSICGEQDGLYQPLAGSDEIAFYLSEGSIKEDLKRKELEALIAAKWVLI